MDFRTMNRRRAGMRNRQRGSELVEFAFTSFLLFMLLFGIIEFSIALFNKATMTNAAREGARTGILFRPSPRDLGAEDAAIRDAVERYADAYLISLGGPAEMSVDIQRSDNASFSAGDDLTVTVEYPFRFLLIPGFVADMGAGLDLSSTAVMRAE